MRDDLIQLWASCNTWLPLVNEHNQCFRRKVPDSHTGGSGIMALPWLIKSPDHFNSTETFLGLNQSASKLHLTLGGQKPCKCEVVKAT